MKFGQLILRRIVKIVATKCQILRLKYTKIDFGWGSAPNPAGELTALPQPPSWIQGALLITEGGYRKGGEGEREGKAAGRGRGGEGEGRVREGRKGGEGTPVCIFKFSSE